MNSDRIKNNIAFKEVFLNNGYEIKECKDKITIKEDVSNHAFVKEKESGEFTIKLFDREIDIEDAKKIINELKKSIDLIEYIDFMVK